MVIDAALSSLVNCCLSVGITRFEISPRTTFTRTPVSESMMFRKKLLPFYIIENSAKHYNVRRPRNKTHPALKLSSEELPITLTKFNQSFRHFEAQIHGDYLK